MLPWEQVIMRMRVGRMNQLAPPPPHGPINATPAPFIHQRKVARLHLQTPLQTYTEHVQGEPLSPYDLLTVLANVVFCSKSRRTTQS